MEVNFIGRAIQLPDFIVIGAPKSGTTSLNYYLAGDKRISMTEPKEPNFFAFHNNESLYQSLMPAASRVNLLNYDEAQYLALFEGVDAEQCGEASTCYLQYHNEVIENLERYYGDSLPKLKLVVILRNPVERVFSHYQMFVRWGIEKRKFSDAIQQEIDGSVGTHISGINYIQSALAAENVAHYLDRFGANLKIYLYDDIVANREGVVRDCFSFLGLEYRELSDEVLHREHNVGGVPRGGVGRLYYDYLINNQRLRRFLAALVPTSARAPIKDLVAKFYLSKLNRRLVFDECDQKILRSVFKDDICSLSKIIERDLSHWLKD